VELSGRGAWRLAKLGDVERLPEAFKNITKTQAMKVTANAVGITISNATGRLSMVALLFPLSHVRGGIPMEGVWSGKRYNSRRNQK
jgi:hypothetical protein